VGFAVLEGDVTSDDVLSRADVAMYTDKGAGARPPRHLRSVE
jgi:hypothetical protein